MSEYPYLAATLPMLSFDSTEFPSRETFLDEAEKWLSEAEFDALSAVAFDDYDVRDHRLELVEDYRRFEYALRKDIAAFVDARRQGHDHKTQVFPQSLIKESNPLEAERRLLRIRWDFVADRLNTHFWDLPALAVYFLQIQMLERLAMFDEKAGLQRFEALVAGESLEKDQTEDPAA